VKNKNRYPQVSPVFRGILVCCRIFAVW